MNVKSVETTSKFVLYLRISTAKSGGIDSNGIAAQERDLNIFLAGQKDPVTVGKFVEVISGACNERPQLEAALNLCRETGSSLLVQKVDRLSRDVEFVARLLKDKQIQLRVANLPNADNFQIHLFAALSSAEREFISQRTKAAMAVAKLKGKKFGNPNIAKLNKERKRKARNFRSGVSPIVLPLRKKGMTYEQIAVTLNDMGLKTSRGNNFYAMQVKRIIDRCEEVA